jgi:hypothetical protein
MTTQINIDDSQLNADFTKFRRMDIPGVGHAYHLFDQAGVDHMADDGAQQIVEFAESHPWLDGMGVETAWIISNARKAAEAKKTSNERK